MNGLTQTKIFDLPCNSNVYCATVLRSIDGKEKIVLACKKRELITLESKIINDIVEAFIVQLNFSNIPSNADIISIHCINRSKEYDDFAFGITYALIVDERNAGSYLNIYSGSPGSSLEAIIENCETLELNFIPFKLTHGIYICGELKKGMWLLSGNDKKIHAYKSDKLQICEENIKEYFVEFEDTNDSVILSFGTKLFSDYTKRISFLGCEMGLALVRIVDSKTNQILYSFMEHFLSPITVLQLFNIYNKTFEIENINSGNADLILDCDIINEKEQVCFLVGSVIDCAVVYMDILKNDMKIGTILTNSDKHKGILTSLIADVNFDSKNEIMLGTHGNYILNYAYENNQWVEQQQLDMRHSVYTISYVDITGEGVKDGIIMSDKGIHHLKHEPRDIVKILRNRLKQ